MNASQLSAAIISGNLSNSELNDIAEAVKYAREKLQKQVKYSVKVGSAVRYSSSRQNAVVTGEVVKVAQKYATVKTAAGLWKVPMNMLEII